MGNTAGKTTKARTFPRDSKARDNLYRAQEAAVWSRLSRCDVRARSGDDNEDGVSQTSESEEVFLDDNDSTVEDTFSTEDKNITSVNHEKHHVSFSATTETKFAEPVALDEVDGPEQYWRDVPDSRGRSRSFDEVEPYIDKDIDLTKYQFPFENLVFEGGGNKGLAYCGGIKLLEELGIMSQIRRYAGASAGAMTAALLAVGYNADDIEYFLGQNLSEIFLDHSCSYLSLLPNLINGFGWNPGKRISKWLGSAIKGKTNDPDYTFAQLYKQRKIELCVAVTNLSAMDVEFFHPKTTPNVPIRKAVRMSMSIPGLFQACRLEITGIENIYVDGGVLCNYPIMCFDGWWLSMKKEDRFMKRLNPEEDLKDFLLERKMFKCEEPGQFHKTLGMLLFAENERDVLRDGLEKRDRLIKIEAADTKLKREKTRTEERESKTRGINASMRRAVNAFFKVLEKHQQGDDDTITRQELKDALNDASDFPKRYYERIFGNKTPEEIFTALDDDRSEKIEFNELRYFVERMGISLQTHLLGHRRRKINSLATFFGSLKSTLTNTVKGVYIKEADIERTIGINTGHVDTTDFDLEDGDRTFILQQGKRATESFLKYYVEEKKPPEKVQVLNANLKNDSLPDQSNNVLTDDKQTIVKDTEDHLHIADVHEITTISNNARPFPHHDEEGLDEVDGDFVDAYVGPEDENDKGHNELNPLIQ